MKKYLYTLLLATFLLPTFYSCSSDSDSDDNNGTENGNYKDYPYSQLTTEQQKKKLETDANQFITKIDALTNAKSVELLRIFNELCEISDPELPTSKDPASIIAIKDFYGKYTWDFKTSTWSKSESADKLVFILPATTASRKDSKNDGKIEVTGVSSGSDLDGYQLPKELKALLYASDAKVGTINVNATEVNSANLPKTAKIEYIFDNYTFVLEAEKGTENKSTFSLKNGSEIIMEGVANLAGNLVELVNGNNSNLGKGSSEIKLLNNLVVIGEGDLGKTFKDLDAIDKTYSKEHGDKWNWTAEIEKKYYEEKAAVWNNNMAGSLVSRDDKTKIAEIKVRIKEDKYTYTMPNPETGKEETYTDIDYNETIGLKFKDETIVDMEVYFGEGFDTVIKKWNDFITKFN